MFNLRDFDRVIKGMQLTIPEAIDDVAIMKRLWIHEVRSAENVIELKLCSLE